MEPFRVITSPDELSALRINSIACPPRDPQHAVRKAWDDLFTTFESTREANTRETWAHLTLHCPDDAPEAWVLWDAGAKAPAPLKPSSWMTIIPDRKPARKAHTTLGYAKAAVRGRIYGSRGSREDMTILEMDPATGTWTTLYEIPQGTPKSDLPW